MADHQLMKRPTQIIKEKKKKNRGRKIVKKRGSGCMRIASFFPSPQSNYRRLVNVSILAAAVTDVVVIVVVVVTASV